METRLRVLIVLAGLPEPVVNHKVYYADGRLGYRCDLCYPDHRIVVEYDGRERGCRDLPTGHRTTSPCS